MQRADAPPVSMLRQVRLARGLSGRELARACGVNPGLLSAIEHQRTAPWPAFRRRAAAALEVDEALLFGQVHA